MFLKRELELIKLLIKKVDRSDKMFKDGDLANLKIKVNAELNTQKAKSVKISEL